MKESKKVQEEIRNKLSGYEVTPPDSLWTSIETQLNSQKRKRRIRSFFWAAAAIIALLLAGFLYFNSQDNKDTISEPNKPNSTSVISSNVNTRGEASVAQTSENKNTEFTVGKMSSVETSDQIATSQTNEKNNKSQGIQYSSENTLAQNNVDSDFRQAGVNQSNRSNSSGLTSKLTDSKQKANKGEMKAKGMNSPKSKYADEVKNKKILLSEDKTTQVSTRTNTNTAATDNDKKTSSFAKAEGLNTKVPQSGVSLLEGINEYQVRSGKATQLDEKHLTNNLRINNGNRYNRTGYFFIEANAGVGIALSSMEHMDPKIHDIKDRNEKSVFVENYGINTGYRFINGLHVSTGLHYQNIIDKVSYENPFEIIEEPVLEAVDTINSGGSQQIIYDTVSVNKVGKYNETKYRRYKTVSIPLIVGYEVGIKGPWSIEGQVGVLMNIYSSVEGSVYTDSDEPVNISSTDASYYDTGFSLGFYSSIGVLYNCSPNLSFTLKPTIRSMGTITSEDSPFTQKYSTFNLQAGVRIYF